MGKNFKRRRIWTFLCVASIVSGLHWGTASALAAGLPVLWQAPEDSATGSSVGRLHNPWAIDARPTDGHLFVADVANARVSEYTVWGEFVKAWGWNVSPDGEPGDTATDQFEICTTACQSGVKGSGPGQVSAVTGIAAATDGSVYAFDVANQRVQKFDANGNFSWMAGGGVNQGPLHPGNLCTGQNIVEGDVCGAGTAGSGSAQFAGSQVGDRVAVGPEGNLFVGDVERIQRLSPLGEYLGEVTVSNETIQSLDLDASGNFYAVYGGKPNIHKLNSAGAAMPPTFLVDMSGAPSQTPLALDVAGNLFASADPPFSGPGVNSHVVELTPDGATTLPTSEEEEQGRYFAEANDVLNGVATSSACGIDGSDLYVSYFSPTLNESVVRAYGPPPDSAIPGCEPPLAPPAIAAQFAVKVEPDRATLKAQINPRFWSDTTYYLEYGTGKCSEGGCTLRAPVSPLELTGKGNVSVPTETIDLAELQSATTYRFRFVAQSSGGGPAFGIAPEGGEATAGEGLEGTFNTPPLEEGLPNCPNSAHRNGFGSLLPDCRAYEMVSPVEKENGDIIALFTLVNESARLDQSDPYGGALTYSAYRAFGEPASSPFVSQYMALRTASGWDSHAISPSRGIAITGELDSEYRAFTEDLCSGWLLHDTDPPLAENAIEGFANLYRRDEGRAGCSVPTNAAEALTTAKPLGHEGEPAKYRPEFQGASATGAVAAFRADDRLTENAAAGTKNQCYEATNGQLSLISILPNGTANPTNCSIGTANNNTLLRWASVDHAVSADGSRIYWTATSATSGPGRIYLREKAKDLTIAVSAGGEAASGKGDVSRFLTAAADGSIAIYSVGNPEVGGADLYEYNASTETSTLISHKVKGILGASDDASRVYVVSEEGLDGASAGQPNLYLYQAPSGVEFIASLSSSDALAIPQFAHSAISLAPFHRTSRVSPDGLHATFMSNGSPTGFDNRDAASDEPVFEVYRYDADAEKLDCVSCLASGARPSGRELEIQFQPSGQWAAAQIPGWETQHYASRVLSNDGSRLFFESFEALVGRDTNQAQDVYEWEEPGTGTCSIESNAYRAANGGCLYLISSGKNPFDVEFIDASANGDDVFFATGQGFVSQDPGLIDIYDARVGGGFAPPAPPPATCQGDACQVAAPPPVPQVSASATRQAFGDLKPRRCPRGKRKVVQGHRVRCVKKHPKRKSRGHRQAHHEARQMGGK